MNKTAIISDKCPAICDKFTSLSYKLIYTHSVDGFISYEQNHADMQCIAFPDAVFVLRECTYLQEKLNKAGYNVITTSTQIRPDYPDNILLNAKLIGNHLIGKIRSLDENLVKYCNENGYRFIDVKQGYSACSITKVSNNAVITSDESIYRTLKNSVIDVLKISNDNIELYGAQRGERGFIGGASVLLDENNLLFFGDIEQHPDYNLINDFCNSRNVNVLKIDNIPLTDIGGAILLIF